MASTSDSNAEPPLDKKLGFLDLPCELRLKIYSFLFHGEHFSLDPPKPTQSDFTRLLASICFTCQLCLNEAYPVLISEATLVSSDRSYFLSLLSARKWFDVRQARYLHLHRPQFFVREFLATHKLPVYFPHLKSVTFYGWSRSRTDALLAEVRAKLDRFHTDVACVREDSSRRPLAEVNH
jgi:hypothetical protein